MTRGAHDRGQINFLKIFLFLGAVTVAYLGWIFTGPYLDYFGVRKAVKLACNGAYVDRDEEHTRDAILRQWKELNIQDAVLNADGSIERTPTPFDEHANVDVDLRKDPPQITVAVHYTQHIVFPYIGKERDLEWNYEHTEDLAVIKW
jgi:hypothetical protein